MPFRPFCLLQQRRHALKLGCLPPLYYSHLDPFFGLDVLIGTFLGVVLGGKSPLVFDRDQPYGSVGRQMQNKNSDSKGSTFAARSPSGDTVRTIDPENIATIHGRPLVIEGQARSRDVERGPI
ncbi:hypothetical protein AOQ84DRAFT_376274 [Glonium stellatum]|uniref:Uncharacterized protein n=1 Tax=Glonium stellatum TaxID=574774 RepID=A0A8E2JTP3_9PEZI|nr:hypothetical protein AOQ84DRAFT_376274 [Glonium stellatum]